MSQFRRNVGRKKLIAEINVVPYVDVTFVLLIIFMVTAPIVQQVVDVNLPNTPTLKNKVANDGQTPFVITITKEGFYKTSENPKLLVNKEQLNFLIAETMARVQLNKKQVIYIQGDENVAYGRVVNLFTLLKVNGVSKVALLTEPGMK